MFFLDMFTGFKCSNTFSGGGPGCIGYVILFCNYTIYFIYCDSILEPFNLQDTSRNILCSFVPASAITSWNRAPPPEHESTFEILEKEDI